MKNNNIPNVISKIEVCEKGKIENLSNEVWNKLKLCYRRKYMCIYIEWRKKKKQKIKMASGNKSVQYRKSNSQMWNSNEWKINVKKIYIFYINSVSIKMQITSKDAQKTNR